MQSISLPIRLQKDITVYTNYALPLCIIKSTENYDKSILTHFDNIYLMRDKKNYLWMDFLERDGYFIGDFFNVEYLNLKKAFELPDIFSFISDTLLSNKYLIVLLNGYFMENSSTFKKFNYPVNVLVFSISFIEKQIGTVILAKDGNYKIEKFSFDAFYTAFYNYNLDELGNRTYADWYKISVLSLIPLDSNIKPDLLIQQINDFITSKNMKLKLRKEIVDDRGDEAFYGISVYPELIKSLKETALGNQVADYRQIHLIYEQVKFTEKKLDFLQKEGIVPADVHKQFIEIEKLLNFTRLLYIKGVFSEKNNSLYGSIKDKNIINKIIMNITFAQEKQIQILQNL
ncbi:hypothetical protein SAMN04487977_10240 [Treponema bryantii]|uniref:Uncharacterized protein n=1 Tax=Treponema bryantii TaxID=163 RepID=A0A1H9C4P9_9SPIR|nr:hypothetical protein [Treponema bryantii]SEP95951.1 hypothetical protein SAMN04487977_10240 [Treponema bryantii]